MRECKHKWMVFGRWVEPDKFIAVKCPKCNANGSVDDPTRAEWLASKYATEQPYAWPEPDRVTNRTPPPDFEKELRAYLDVMVKDRLDKYKRQHPYDNRSELEVIQTVFDLLVEEGLLLKHRGGYSALLYGENDPVEGLHA